MYCDRSRMESPTPITPPVSTPNTYFWNKQQPTMVQNTKILTNRNTNKDTKQDYPPQHHPTRTTHPNKCTQAKTKIKQQPTNPQYKQKITHTTTKPCTKYYNLTLG